MKISDFCTGLQHIGVPTNDIERTKAFYEHLGFQQVGLRKNYYHKPKEDALILRKEWKI